jgi:signal transduction histidine kinase
MPGERGAASPWRARILDRGALAFAILNILWSAFAFKQILATGRHGLIAAMVTIDVLALGIALSRRVPYQARVLGLLLLVLAGLAAAIKSVGFTFGSGVVATGLALASALLLDGRRALLGWLASILLLLCGAVLIGRGVIANPFDPTLLDTGRIQVGLRYVLIYAAGTVLPVIGTIVLIGHLERSLQETQEALVQAERAERERQAAQEALLQAQKLEVVGRLTSSVAHDFNNALQVIMGSIALVRDDPRLSPSSAEAARVIAETSQNASRLVRDLLAVGRRAPLAPRPLRLDRLVRDLEPSLRRLLPAKITVDCRCNEACPVAGDEAQLQQILLNLALNARDAMPEGGALEIATRADGASILLTVRDTGTGMDAATRARAFEPFFTTKEVGKGTGLGLATVKRVVEQHGGRIDLLSEPGRGTRVEISLPRGALEPAPPPVAASPTKAQPRTILLADDDTAVRGVLVAVLRQAGHTILEADSGDRALELVRANGAAIDLYCTDVVMPGPPLREVIAEIRHLRPGIRVLVCSGYVDEDLILRVIEQEALPFLQKPFAPEELVAKLEALFA